MRIPLSIAVLALAPAALPAPVAAAEMQPPGSYQRMCSNIRMENNFLHATCRGAGGRNAVSSINVLSCASDIGVDAEGGLICAGPGAGGPLPPQPGVRPPVGPPYGGGGWDQGRPGRPGRESVTLFGARNFRGPALTIDGPTANLNRSGFNDRTVSIRLERRSGPWLLCSDADFRGRCVTVRGDIADVGRLGLGRSISSLRPVR